MLASSSTTMIRRAGAAVMPSPMMERLELMVSRRTAGRLPNEQVPGQCLIPMRDSTVARWRQPTAAGGLPNHGGIRRSDFEKPPFQPHRSDDRRPPLGRSARPYEG